MSYSPYEPAPPERDRWGLNLPLAVGVVVVFLIAVIAWVVIDAPRGDDEAVDPTLPPPAPTTNPIGSLVVPTTTTTPPLLPTTVPVVPVQPTTPPPVPTPTAAPPAPTIPVTPTTTVAPPPPPPTAAPTPPATLSPPGPDAVPGDLGVPNRPMVRPVCSGYITVIASNVASTTSAAGIQQILAQYPGSEYLRTDESCTSLDRSGQGEPIYVVYFGPYPEAVDACLARADGPSGAYARQLSNDIGPNHSVACD